MKKSRIEFIKEGHAAACSIWKAKIEKEFPKLFVKEEFKNEWIKHKSGSFIFAESKGKGYGINSRGDWDVYDAWTYRTHRHHWTPATDKEVEQALTKEAKKRGYKKGNYTCLFHNKSKNSFYSPMFDSGSNRLWLEYGCCFEKGKWATIIETITKAEAEKELGKTIID